MGRWEKFYRWRLVFARRVGGGERESLEKRRANERRKVKAANMTFDNRFFKNSASFHSNAVDFSEENARSGAESQRGPTLELSCVPKINGALYFNDFRIFNAFDVTNNSERELVDLRVDFWATPEFFEPFSVRVDRVAPGERLRVDRFDVSLNFDYLASISEETRGEIRVEAFENVGKRGGNSDANSCNDNACDGETEASETPIMAKKFSIAVCANDEWLGASVLPSLLAAYVTPNVDGIARLQTEVAELLQEQGVKSSLEGYQARDKKRVYEIVRAVYQAVVRRQIHYANPPASFGLTGQRVRFPDKILRDKLGTCLDLSLLFASLLEQCGLHPLILLYAGHAFVGCHLRETCLSESFDDNLQALRKLAELDELVVFETTLATVGGSASFNVAENVAKKRLADDERFVGALDVRRARVERIRPIPLRRNVDDCCEIDFDARKTGKRAQTSTDEARSLVPDWEPTEVEPAAPKTRVDRWKQSLLDLSARNKLLNCKESQTVAFLFPENRLGALEDRLVDGETFAIRSARSLKVGDSALRDLESIERREGRDMLEVLVDEEFRRGALFAWPNLDEAELLRRLTKIFRDAESNLNEGGVNTLFLALGMVERVVDRDGKIYRAPFLLVPMKLERLAKQKGFALSRSDEDVSINVTLLELLRRDYNKTIPGIDPKNLPTDEKGVDVDKIFQIFQRELVGLDGWELKKDICLGNFFFQKFVMWSDLNDHMEELIETPLVKHLVWTPKERFDDGIPETRSEDVDADFSTDEILAPLSADSSQIAALLTAAAGKNFVLQGPPGAGKSQTIANMIAHCLAQGKTTLFVAEKRAALDVVHRRLCGLGLEPFCLELHSNKSGKRRLLEQLQSALEFSQEAAIKDWPSVTREIETLKNKLNEYVAELRRVYPNGRTLYEAIARLSETEPWRDKASKLRLRNWCDKLSNVSVERFEKILSIGDSVASVLRNIEESAWAELRDFAATDWTPRWNREVCDAARATRDAAQNLLTDVARLWEIAVGSDATSRFVRPKVSDFATFSELAEAVVEAGNAAPLGFLANAPRETAILARRWLRLNETFKTTFDELERDGLRQLVNWRETSLNERLATHRAVFRFDLAPSATFREDDAEENELAEVRGFEAFLSQLVAAFSEIVQRLDLPSLNPAAFGRFVDERRLEEVRRLLEALRSRSTPTRSLLGADWRDFSATARRLAFLGRRRDAERVFFAGFDLEKLASTELTQLTASKGIKELPSGAFSLRDVRSGAPECDVATSLANESDSAAFAERQNELEAAGFSRDEANRAVALKTSLDETLRALDDVWDLGAEVFRLYNISDSPNERVASLYRALLGATATEFAPPTDVFLASDWSEFSPQARRLVASIQKRDALARQIDGYDASILLAFNVNQALDDVSGVPKGVWKLRGVQKNVDVSANPNVESSEGGEERKSDDEKSSVVTFGAATDAFLPTLDALAEATSNLARRLGLREETNGERTAIFSRRLLDAARDFELPLSLLGASDWNDFGRRGRDAIEIARACETFAATTRNDESGVGEATDEPRFEETTRREAEAAEASGRVFAAKENDATRWNSAAWKEIVEDLSEARTAELEASRKYDEASLDLEDFNPDALKRFDVAEGRRLIEAATSGFFLFRLKSKKKALAYFEQALRPERNDALKSNFFARAPLLCDAIERWRAEDLRRDETRAALRETIEASRALARREQEKWEKEIADFATYCERWDWRMSDQATSGDWNRFGDSLNAGDRVVEILDAATENETERRFVAESVVSLARELRKASENDCERKASGAEAEGGKLSQSNEENGLDESQALVAAFFALDSAAEENASSETEESGDAFSTESPALADVRFFDESWKRFADALEPFLCSFKTWNEEFALVQREIQRTLATLAPRLGVDGARNEGVDVDVLTRVLDAGDAIFERVQTALAANPKQIPTVLNYLGKSWRVSASVDSEKGGALRRWLDSWARFEESWERLTPLFASWKAERDEQTKEFNLGFAAYRSRFETTQPVNWNDLETTIDGGERITEAARALADDDPTAIERIERFWTPLNEFWNDLSEGTKEVCDVVDRFLKLWNEYDAWIGRFNVALQKEERLQCENDESSDASNVEIKGVGVDDKERADEERRDVVNSSLEFSVARILKLDAALEGGEKKGVAETEEDEEQRCDALPLTLNSLVGNILRCALARIRSFKTERSLGANAARFYLNGEPDARAALQICDAASALERFVRFLIGETCDGEENEPNGLSSEFFELCDRCGVAFDDVLKTQTQTLLGERAEAVRRDLQTLKKLESELVDAASYRGCVDLSQGDEYVANCCRFADGVLRNERNFQFWNRWNRLQVSVAQEFPELVEAVRKREIAADEIAPVWRRSLFAQFADEIVDASPTLRYFVGAERERLIERFRELDARRSELTQRLVVARLASRLPQAGTGGALSAAETNALTFLQREIGKKRHTRSIRQMLDETRPIFSKLKPCLLMSPLSVAQYVPAGGEKYDVVIFDEASQIPVWDAVGAIARGTQLIVVGDSKQLPPTGFFQRQNDDAGGGDVEETESILDECLAAQIPARMLTWHYRSRRESLIAFSNRRYYDGKLTTFPSSRNDSSGVRLRFVENGLYEKGGSKTNKPEAVALVKEAVERLRSPGFAGKSLGVVTFNEAQRRLIEDLFDDARQDYPEIEPFFESARPEPVFVKNLENVQGDERDVIYFSIGSGPDVNGVVSMNFGPLNAEGGERRLNVAITRAKEENVIFSSIRSSQIELSRTQKRGPSDLKAFLEYAESGGAFLFDASGGDAEANDFAFERSVADFLRSKGFEIVERVGRSRSRVDLAVVAPGTRRGDGEYAVAIECDGTTYASAATARDRDVLRPQMLERFGWQTVRVWATDWLFNRTDAQERLEKAVVAALERWRVEEKEREKTRVATSWNASQVVENKTNERKTDASAASSNADERVYPAFDYATSPNFAGLLDKPERFYDPDFRGTLRRQMREIIDVESPVSEALLFKRMRTLWGFSRAGEKIRETLRAATPRDAATTRDGDGDVFWRVDANPREYDGYRVPGEESNAREFAEIPTVELVNALKDVAKELGSWDDEEAIFRETARRFGVHRLTQPVKNRLAETSKNAKTELK